ncbi:unnamed protein product [Gadus morhua 'NCC']
MTWSHFWLCFLALSVPNIANVQARQALNHVNSICSTWGRHHFKTFDGDVYQFPGLCGYNLVSDCHEMYREFSVHIQKSLVDGHPAVNELVVTINDLVFHLTKRNVSLNGDHINLPYLNAGIQLERNAVYTKLQAKVGLVVMWNGDDAVMVELDSDYHNRTCGLCGDFNGVPVYNEFIHHNRKIHPIEFGNGQRVHRPNDECEDPYEEEEQELDAQDLEYPELEDQAVEIPCKEFRPICEKVIYSEAWSSCASLVDPAPYTQACVQDMCGCGNSTNDFCVCSTLAEFSRQCSHAGGQPPSWRTPQFCAKMCPFNMVYEESGSPCMASCTVSDISSLCEDHKMDGCFCPAGTVWDNISQRGCVSQTECQCKHDKIYNSGEVYRQDSKECLCYQGRWDCKSLPSPATCAVEEGSHVTTFDGKAYIFHGNCHYVLAKIESKDDTSPKFTIFVQLVPCVNQEFDTCLKSVKVLLNNDKNNMLAFSADGKVRHNMQIISLPYNTGDINIFQASSFHILLQTRFGLQIQVQHVPVLQVYVTLEQRSKTKTRGLCGNYNMMLSDDMKTPQGIVEGTASSFGNSWKSSSTCPERDERLESPCSVSVENEQYAEHWCSMLTRPDGPFTNCHAMVDPELYHKRCIYATCNCEKTEDCMCAVFSSYARACASKGVFLSDWRVNVCDKYTRGCPESQSFSYKLQRCQWTCRQLSSEQQSCTSDFLPVDGCSCPEGTYQEEHGACVPMNKCPCYHNGVHIKPGKSISIKEQHCLCSNGKLHCRTWKTSSQACPTPKVYLNCSSTDVRDLGVQCARTCRNTEIDSCYLTECESGCQCPSGLLDDGKGSCVKEHECPCQHDHTLYASGSEIKDQCNTCTCRKGNWECTEKKCPGTCIIYGSGHYRTFDQRTYGFQGQCAYVAIQNKCGNKSVEDIFRVITENIPCGTTGTTCSKSVRIQLGNKEIKLAKGKYEVSDLAMGSEIKYTIRPVGMYLAVEASLGITVLWDRKTTIRILLEPQHSAGVCGLCGDFNGDVQNDFTTQSQMVVSSPLEFANSWKALSSCLDAEASADSCVLQPHRHNWAQIQCSIIRSVTFQDCHKKVNPIPFYENCVKDSCACDSGGDCECFCTAVAAYAQACNEVSVCVAWRTPEICPVFCDYYNEGELCEWHYKPCHEPCYETCRNPHGCNNSIPNLEGCYPVCPEDKPIFDEDKGICVESCDGCIYNGTYYNDNDVIYNRDNKPTCFNNYSTYSLCHLNDNVDNNNHCTTNNNYRDNKSTCFNNYSTYSNGHLNDYIHYNTHCTNQYNCCNINPRYHFTYCTSNYKSTTTVTIPTTTTGCVCIVDGKHYKPGETIYDRKDIGSGICLSMICSAICELRNQTEPCHSTPSSTPSPPPMPPLPTCPEWDVTQNETFVLCNCTMAKCIENTTIEIVPYVCPPREEISCASGKKPVLIDDKYGCCKYYTCPCECEGWGDPHYITFDGVFYSYQGNCTYVLMEEITPKHNLKVIVDNVYCEPTEDVSCPRSIIVSYNSQVITLKNQNLMGAAKMEVLSSGVTVKVPYYHQGIKVLSTGMSLILEIPTLYVVITFGITGFSISLPPRDFVNNTKGHCGTCNNNKADDCMLPGGQLIQNCEVMADFYLVEDLYKPSCHAPSVIPTDSPLPPPPLTTCKPDSVCGVLLGSLFEACHAIVSPDKFYQGCIFDSCHVANPVVQCTSLQVYAAACAQAGVCLYWRDHTPLCPSNCPADKVYKPCGPAEQQTCEDKAGEKQMNFTTEGCFCPDGMKLFNKESNICVDKCGCLDSEGVPREFNEIFDQNCQTCICEESTKSVTCKPKDCPAIPAGSCTKPGFILVNQTLPADRCCLHYVCQCDSSTCPVGDLSCDVGYIPEVSVPTGHCCPVRQCLPKEVCVHKGMEYQVGSPVPVVKCQNCTCSRQVIEDSGLLEITCKMLACDQNCGLGYKYVSDKGLEECCGRCLQTHCVVDRNITQELLKEGETWSPPGNMCEFYTCVKIGETLTTIMSTTVCPHFQQSNCYPDTVQTAANGCCKICVEMDKGCKRGSMRQRITHNRCQAREDVDMPYCEGSCNTFARYEEMAAGLEHTCAGCWESRFSNRTVELECLNGDLVPYTYVHVEECSCGNTNCNRAARLPARKRRANIGV